MPSMNRLIKFRRKYFLACADDCVTLQEARKAIQSNPLAGGLNQFFESSVCRLLIVNRINLVEALLFYWKQLDRLEILRSYFPPEGEKVPNEKRLKNLKEAFEANGITVSDEIFSKYLALKILRNFIVHGDFSANYDDFIKEQGYPSDLMDLDVEHSREVISVTSEMIQYILETKPLSEDIASLDIPIGLRRSIDNFRAGFKPEWASFEFSDDLGLARRDDIARMWWTNLEKISVRLTASSINPDEQSELIQVAIDSWKEYWRLTIEASFIDEDDLTTARDFLLHLASDNVAIIAKTAPEDINKNRVIGSELQRFFPNVLPVSLLVRQIRPVASERNEIRRIGRLALLCWEVSYLYAKREKPNEIDYDHLSTYRRIIDGDDYWQA